MASNIEATKKGYEAFQRGDIPSLMKDLLHDDCTWIAPGPKDKLLGLAPLEVKKRLRISSRTLHRTWSSVSLHRVR